jgi:peptide/nickel transport system substrate-binding protein
LKIATGQIRAWLTIIVLVGVVFSTACSDTRSGAIRFGLASEPATLDPRFATDATSYRIIRLIFEALVDFDENYQAVPSLARWEQLSPVKYRFYLNQGATFHNGQDLTSDDVIATYESILDPAIVSPHRSSLENIVSMTAPSRDIVDFELRQADPLFPGPLVIGIMPRASIEASPTSIDVPIGSGPFSAIDVVSASRLVLRRIADQQEIEFLTVKDPTVRALKIAHGELDIIQGSMTPELVEWLAGRDGVQSNYRAGTTFTYLGFNLGDPMTGNSDLRRAISHAVDRTSLTRFMFGGHARLASAIFTPEHWAGHDHLPALAYDPQRARTILSQLGYGVDNPLRLSYKTSSDHFRLRIATAIQDQLAQVGIKLDIQSYDWGTFYADVKAGRFQLYSLSWVGLKQPDIFRYAFHSESIPPAGANRGRYMSPKVDELIERAETETKLAVRATIYRQIQQHLLNDLPYIPMWFEDTTLIYRHSIVGYDTVLDGHYDGLINVSRSAIDE